MNCIKHLVPSVVDLFSEDNIDVCCLYTKHDGKAIVKRFEFRVMYTDGATIAALHTLINDEATCQITCKNERVYITINTKRP